MITKVDEYLDEIVKNEEITLKQFEPITLDEVNNVLGLTIKKDEANKLIVFLSLLSAYTDNNQFNISLNAPSSTGKSYIPLEIAELFPKEDVITIGYCSPTAFFHDWGSYDKENKRFYVDLERKILIFLDQPQTLLLERIRPLLSHDRKEIEVKITDKGKKHGLKTKNVIIRGYSSVVFCSASQVIDEQEATRFILLSPETNTDKVGLGIREAIRKETDKEAYYAELTANPERKRLIERIKAIKHAGIKEINLHDSGKVEEMFFSSRILKPRHQRDIKRIISIIKANALLNLWQRRTAEPNILITTDEDIRLGFEIWEKIAYSQELNISPYVYAVWQDIILPTYLEKGEALTRKEIMHAHQVIYERPLEAHRLNRDILPMLENAGLIEQETDPNDKRNKLITPTNQAQTPKNPKMNL